MEIFLDSKSARLWTDGASPCVYLLVKTLPEGFSQISFFFKKKREVIRKIKQTHHSEIYAITDFTGCSNAPALAAELFVNEEVKTQTEYNVVFNAFVLPPLHSANTVLHQIIKKRCARHINVYSSFEEALHHINNIRTTRTEMRYKKSGQNKFLQWFSL